MRGKIIVIEGTDCSGKETQSKKLIQDLKQNGYKCQQFSFPMYDTPTGKIIGGPYLGKENICEGWFKEGAPNVDSKVSSLYYAADRLYNIEKINNLLDQNVNVILDRYVYSNMAHQGGKLDSKENRIKIYEWIEKLEFDFLNLPQADIRIFLHMPTEKGEELKKSRSKLESLDQNERDLNYLKKAENAYLEVADVYNFKIFECVNNDNIKSIEEINLEISNYVLNKLNNKNIIKK